MKNLNVLFTKFSTIYLLIFIFLVSSCSLKEYPNYHTEKNQLSSGKRYKKLSNGYKNAEVAIKKTTPETNNQNAVIINSNDAKIATVVEQKQNDNTIASNTSNNSIAVQHAPAKRKAGLKDVAKTTLKIISKDPIGVTTIFTKNKDIASVNSDNDRHSLLWIVVVLLLILWLLGFLFGGFGNIIHILLIVALVLIILRLLSNN